MELSSGDFWSEIIKSEEEGGDIPNIEAVYQRRNKPHKSSTAADLSWSVKGARTNFINGPKRDSWTRSLSTRGRESIAVHAYVNNQPQKKPARRKKPAIPKGKVVKAPDFQKEKEYFRDVDAFELLEESPSPKKSSTWTMGEQVVSEMPHLSTRLEKWLISKKFNRACGPSSTLSKIFENSATHLESICDNEPSESLALKTPETSSASNTSVFRLIPSCDNSLAAEDVPVRKIKTEAIDLEDERKQLVFDI